MDERPDVGVAEGVVDAMPTQKPKGLVEAIEEEPGGRGGKCMICDLPYKAEVDQALRIALTGRWTVMRVLQEMQRSRGFKGGYNRLLSHAKLHMGRDA